MLFAVRPLFPGICLLPVNEDQALTARSFFDAIDVDGMTFQRLTLTHLDLVSNGAAEGFEPEFAVKAGGTRGIVGINDDAGVAEIIRVERCERPSRSAP